LWGKAQDVRRDEDVCGGSFHVNSHSLYVLYDPTICTAIWGVSKVEISAASLAGTGGTEAIQRLTVEKGGRGGVSTMRPNFPLLTVIAAYMAIITMCHGVGVVVLAAAA